MVLSSMFSLTHIACSPMIGLRSIIVGHDMMDVVSVGDSSYAKLNGSIIINSNDAVRTSKRGFIFIFCAASEENLLSYRILIWHTGGILSLIIFVNETLLLVSNDLPICNVFAVD